LTVLFQPHLFTRTRDFADGFAEVLDMADELLLLDIYPARELPIEGVDSEMILSRMKLANKRKCGKQESIDIVKAEKPELLLTVGAGDIDTIGSTFKTDIRKCLRNAYGNRCLLALAGLISLAGLVVLMSFIEVKKAELVCKKVKGFYTRQPVFY
jgi:hypothetical protein